jgi:muramoyltetrapeptide carboxypeptidase
MPLEKAQTCIDTLQDWGYRVRVGETVGGDSLNYFSGSDGQRLDELQQMLDDPGIHAILCGRGGYGLTRIIDRVDLGRFSGAPKWIIGFSDITVLHTHILTRCNVATLHAPMAGAFNDGGVGSAAINSLRLALAGEPSLYRAAPHAFNRYGKVTGRLIGGNLALLAHLTGSLSEPDMKGAILFLEDVGEYLYNIDRMLRQLKRSGKLQHLAGLLVGGFTESRDTTRPFGASAEEIIREVIGDTSYPVAFGFPVSHGPDNVALKIGVVHRLGIGPEGALLQE